MMRKDRRLPEPSRLSFEVKFLDDGSGSFTGYASIFGGEPDSYGDVVAPGAFARTLAEHKAAGTVPLMLWQHDIWAPIGAWTEIREDATGLAVAGRLVLASAKGAEAYALLKGGALNGLSIGYRERAAERRPGGGRLLKDLELIEISLVSLPAASRARIDSVKSARADGAAARGAAKERTMDEDENGGADVAERVTALEGSVAGMDARLMAVEEAVGTVQKSAARIEAKLSRPGAVADRPAEPKIAVKAFGGYLRRGREALQPDEIKALRVAEDTAGGYLAEPEFETELVRELVEFSPVRAAARVGTTAAGSVIIPKRTGVTNATWEGEAEDSAESEPAFAQAEIFVHEMRTYTDISNQLLEDAGADVEGELRTAFAEDFGKKEGTAFVNGTGVKQPGGLMQHADIDFTANGHATVLAADPLITLMYALPAAYRNQSTWMMNGTTLAAVRKLKDGQNNYLWQPSYQEGQPETLLGRPLIEAVDMPDVGDGTFPILFGDFAGGYRIYDRVALSILRDPYTMAKKGLVRFWARRRVGGEVVQAARFRKLKMAV